jgi:hypothetical protein
MIHRYLGGPGKLKATGGTGLRSTPALFRDSGTLQFCDTEHNLATPMQCFERCFAGFQKRKGLSDIRLRGFASNHDEIVTFA